LDKPLLMWKLLIFLAFLSGCSVVIKDREELEKNTLRVNCPRVIYTKATYCQGDRAKSSLVQPWSKVRITNLEDGKSITITVMRVENLKGICVPDKYSHILGRAPFRARLDIERCGKEGITECPAKIEGIASYYAHPHHGRESAYGIPYSAYGLYAAHRSLPLGTLLKVVNPENGREAVVKVIDRGPFKKGRVLDLSYEAAKRLGFVEKGEQRVIAYVLRCGE